MTPKRIQRRRSKGWRMPEGAVYVGRPTVFGNPFRVTPVLPLEASLHCFREWLINGECYLSDDLKRRRSRLLAGLPDLRGKDLACWCAEGAPCHADVLLEFANR